MLGGAPGGQQRETISPDGECRGINTSARIKLYAQSLILESYQCGNNLTGLFKIKLKGSGLRIVYKLEQTDLDNIIKIIVISVRQDNEVYEIAAKRESK